MIEATRGGVRLHLFIQPKSSKNEIVGLHNDLLKIKLTAQPIDGKANEALIEFLADYFDIPKRHIILVRGDTGRNKTVELQGLTESEVKLKLAKFGV